VAVVDVLVVSVPDRASDHAIKLSIPSVATSPAPAARMRLVPAGWARRSAGRIGLAVTSGGVVP
jgi:hypothetical protein